VAATEAEQEASPQRPGAFGALMQAALALPILAVAAKAGAAEIGEIGISTLGYKERGLMKVTESVLWGHALLAEVWEVEASGAIDIVSGASPQAVTNISGKPVQIVTGASIHDRRTTGDAKVMRRFGDYAFGASTAHSNEHDYHSKSWAVEGGADLNQRNTTLVASYGESRDRVGSSIDPTLNEPRNTSEYLFGVTQIVSPVDIVQSTLTYSRGRGFYNDPYKFTLTFYPDTLLPTLFPDTRPDHRDMLAWLTRYRRHFASHNGTLQAEYRFFHDDWGITAHTLEVAWEQQVNDQWSVRPGLRYYTQSAADFYSPVVPIPKPDVLSSDQRLGAFGGLSPSLRVTWRSEDGWRVEGTAGYVQNSSSFRLGGNGSAAFVTLRAAYGLLTISRAF
jgi:hypothetical protein